MLLSSRFIPASGPRTLPRSWSLTNGNSKQRGRPWRGCMRQTKRTSNVRAAIRHEDPMEALAEANRRREDAMRCMFAVAKQSRPSRQDILRSAFFLEDAAHEVATCRMLVKHPELVPDERYVAKARVLDS